MQIFIHNINNQNVGEIRIEDLLFNNVKDSIDLLGNLYYQNLDKIIVYSENINPLFFDLKSGIAGEILQKFTNYKMQLVIVGDFSEFKSVSLRDFIYECNNGNQINFVASINEVIPLA